MLTSITKDMKKEFTELYDKVLELMGEDADFLIVVRKGDKGGTAIHGDPFNIAYAMFNSMHANENNLRALDLYQVTAFNASNILANDSPYKNNLLQILNSALHADEQ